MRVSVFFFCFWVFMSVKVVEGGWVRGLWVRVGFVRDGGLCGLDGWREARSYL